MIFDIVIIGFGVIGTETLFKISKDLNKKQKIKIAVIEKEIDKIPGGIAYSKKNSRFGFFNNPLRLSTFEFINWIKKEKNIKNLIDFIQENKNYNLENWLKINDDFKNRKTKNFDEIYFPRLTYSFFLEEKINKIFNFLNYKKISLSFFEGELSEIKKNKLLECKAKKKFKEHDLELNFKNISFKKKKQKQFKIHICCQYSSRKWIAPT